ncbi:MAG: hypothetical protein M3Y91_09435 [Actinomycetota bacterium]|nr:hypothetical protein [Actinomycetota bacterium]
MTFGTLGGDGVTSQENQGRDAGAGDDPKAVSVLLGGQGHTRRADEQ